MFDRCQSVPSTSGSKPIVSKSSESDVKTVESVTDTESTGTPIGSDASTTSIQPSRITSSTSKKV